MGVPTAPRTDPRTEPDCGVLAAEALYLASAQAELEQERAERRHLLGSHHTDAFPRPFERCGPGTLEYGHQTVYAPYVLASVLQTNHQVRLSWARGSTEAAKLGSLSASRIALGKHVRAVLPGPTH